jgi:chromosomal replication initiation ATPase DnaA
MITLKEYAVKIQIPEEDLMGSSRIYKIALARESYWTYLNKNGCSQAEISRLFSRNHVTVKSGIKTIKNLIEIKDKSINHYLSALEINPESFLSQ